jgi:hypothetical protein
MFEANSKLTITKVHPREEIIWEECTGIRDLHKETTGGAGRVAQWCSTCLAYGRP